MKKNAVPERDEHDLLNVLVLYNDTAAPFSIQNPKSKIQNSPYQVASIVTVKEFLGTNPPCSPIADMKTHLIIKSEPPVDFAALAMALSSASWKLPLLDVPLYFLVGIVFCSYGNFCV
jgi:hypothetical protein